MKMDSEVNGSVDEKPDNVLELAIDFAVRGRYPPGLSKDKKRATAYHPQANGLDECLNQTLINSLAKFAQ